MKNTIRYALYVGLATMFLCGVLFSGDMRISRSKQVFAEKDDPEVQFYSSDLEWAVRGAINKPEGVIYQSDLAELTQLDAAGLEICRLDGLEYCTNLRVLDLSNSSIMDTTPLQGLFVLEELDLSNNDILTISALSEMTNLRYLNLYRNYISDIEPLTNLTNLSSLDISWNDDIEDIQPLMGLTNLKKLGASCVCRHYGVYGDLSGISALTALKDLDISHSHVTGIGALASLTNLTRLNIRSTGTTSLNFISTLTQLEYLNISSNYCSSSLTNLDTLSQLEELEAASINLNTVEALANFHALRRLNLQQNAITDISTLSGWDCPLEYLNLASNNIVSPETSLAFTALTELDLSGNALLGVEFLQNLSSLVHLDLSWNPISDITPLEDLASLCWISLDESPVLDIEPLVANTHFGNGCYLEIGEFSYSYEAVEALEARGVTVDVIYEVIMEGEGACEGSCDFYLDAYLSCSLNGFNVVPPTPSTATGDATIESETGGWAPSCEYWPFYKFPTERTFTLHHTVNNVTGAQIHIGGPGQNGPVLIDLGKPDTNFSYTLPCWPFSDGELYYVIIQSAEYPNGEIRGQIFACDIACPSCWWDGYGITCTEPVYTHSADRTADYSINVSELLRVIQLYNSDGYHCETGSEDGYAPDSGSHTCTPHDSDYNSQDWSIELTELLRLIQLYNSEGYYICTDSEDGFCAGVK